jgi:hypothetical protein
VRKVVGGRDLPGVQASKFRDLWDHGNRWQGGDMNQARDRRPGPDRIAEEKEAVENLLNELSGQARRMAQAVMDDPTKGTCALAEELGLSPGRISQLRREILNQYRGC